MLIINFEGLKAKGLSKGRYDETFAGEDAINVDTLMEIPCLNQYESPSEYSLKHF